MSLPKTKKESSEPELLQGHLTRVRERKEEHDRVAAAVGQMKDEKKTYYAYRDIIYFHLEEEEFRLKTVSPQLQRRAEEHWDVNYRCAPLRIQGVDKPVCLYMKFIEGTKLKLYFSQNVPA